MLYPYSFADKKRHLSDLMSTVIRDEPRFISNFRRIATGELTFEFRNVRQRCCRIRNLVQSCAIDFGRMER